MIDSREQAPFTFASYEVKPEVVALPVGDYSLPGFQDRISIERKSLEDLIACLMGDNRDRFERELAKARHFDLFAVVNELWAGRKYRCRNWENVCGRGKP